MLEFSILDYDAAPWEQIESCVDHVIYKSKSWMDFICATQSINPLIISIRKDGEVIGFFIGGRLRKGIAIVGSPFEGWNTAFQGISTLAPIPVQERIGIYRELIPFCYATPGCAFFQASDWSLHPEDMEGSGLTVKPVRGYTMDLTLDNKTLLSRFNRASRRAIEKAKEYGLIVQEPADLPAFVDEFYDQLLDVFHKRSQKPTFPRSRVKALVERLRGTGKLLLLETRTPEGRCIATGIFISTDKVAHWWGSTSYRADQIMRPNEILFWDAIQRLKGKGVQVFELGSTGTYKEKYGPAPDARVQILAPRWEFLHALKTLAQKVYYAMRFLPLKGRGAAAQD